MSKKIDLKVRTDLADLSKVLSWFEQINQPPFPDTNTWWECQTLVIEGFTNIVEHAHKNLPTETPVEIEAVRLNRQIEIRIWSKGQPFDLQKKLPDLRDFAENDQERGRGLQIMFAIADHLSYEPQAENRYCLLIRKSY